jgi:hypothetical protein
MPARPVDAPSSVHSPLLLYSLEKRGARPGAQRSAARAEMVACPMSCGSRALKVAVKKQQSSSKAAVNSAAAAERIACTINCRRRVLKRSIRVAVKQQ